MKIRSLHLAALLGSFLLGSAPLPTASAADYIVYEGKAGPGAGKHIVLLAGDEEYRSEEALPQLGKILSQRHGFKCTVLFSVNTNGVIDPNAGGSLSYPEALDSADAIVMSLRYRHWNDDAMKKFESAVNRGIPIIGLRTSTHAFNGIPKESPYAKWNSGNKGGFGRQILGENWVAHHGAHKKEATRGLIEAAAKDEPILRGVTDVFGNSDVYTANPMADSKVLLRGQVLVGMNPTDAPVEGKKNDPLQPIAWTREVKNDAGKVNKILCTTMGAATDLSNEGLRRLVVNGVYWGLGLEVPKKANVDVVGEYKPTMYGFGSFIKGVKPADHALKNP